MVEALVGSLVWGLSSQRRPQKLKKALGRKYGLHLSQSF